MITTPLDRALRLVRTLPGRRIPLDEYVRRIAARRAEREQRALQCAQTQSNELDAELDQPDNFRTFAPDSDDVQNPYQGDQDD